MARSFHRLAAHAVSALLVTAPVAAHAFGAAPQTPPAPAPATQKPAPAPQTPGPAAPAAPRRPAAPARPGTLAVLVTDSTGSPLANVAVTAVGPVNREGTSAADGTLRLLNVRAGTYRLRFEREGSVTFEREVTLRAGETLPVEVSLTAAPAPPPPPEPARPEPAVATTTLPPPGDPRITPVPLFLEKNFIRGREGRRDSPLGCTPTGTATLHQLRDTWAAHEHTDADEWLYVVAGEGVLRLAGAEQKIQAGTFSLVPHTISHTLIPQGRNPLIVISVLSGPPCQSE